MARSLRVGFCISGEGRLFRSAALQAPNLGIVPEIVIARPNAAADLEPFCGERSIKLTRLAPLKKEKFDEEITRLCTEADVDLWCLTFDRIIPPPLVDHFRGRMINVHPALLPAFKGINGFEQAINAGARFIGATIHQVVAEVDAGPIIIQSVIGTRRGDTSASVGARLFGLMRLMFLQVLAWYAEGRVENDEQGRVWIRDAVYGELPISPAIERGFPD